MSMDLLTPIVPEQAWHPNFATLVRRPNSFNADVLADWARGFVDRDGKFVREFQTTFNACFWELYIHAILRERGLSLTFDAPYPDFLVTGPWLFTMEATIASHAQYDLAEHRRAEAVPPSDLNELNRSAIIRLSNSVHAKYNAYKSRYSKLPHVIGRPFIIALAPFDRPHFSISCQRAIEALLFGYYVDEETYLAGAQWESPVRYTRLSSVRKDNGARVELGLFLNGSMPEVSAIVFSTCATWGKLRALSLDPNPNIFFTALRFNPHSSIPHTILTRKADYRETLSDGLRIYHNPASTHPLDPAVFRRNDVFQVYYSHAEEEWVHEQAEGQLLFRTVTTYESKGDADARSASPQTARR